MWPRRGSRHRQPPPHGPNDHQGRRRRDRRNLTALAERTNGWQPRAPDHESEVRIHQQTRGRADGQRSSAPTRGRWQLHTAVVSLVFEPLVLTLAARHRPGLVTLPGAGRWVTNTRIAVRRMPSMLG